MNEQHRRRDDGGERDDDLTRLLRDGDPAGADSGLDPVELANMRRLIAESAERSAPGTWWAGGWSGWMKPALVAATVAGVAIGVWTVNGSLAGDPPEVADLNVTAPRSTSTPPDTETAIASGSVPDSAPAAPSSAAEAAPGAADSAHLIAGLDPEAAAGSEDEQVTEEAATPEATVETSIATENATISVESTTVTAVDDPSPADRHARTVQFTAPLGTRIIWTLDPNFESPIAGQEPRQEQSQ